MVDREKAGARLVQQARGGTADRDESGSDPFDDLCMLAHRMTLRICDDAVPPEIFREIAAAADAIPLNASRSWPALLLEVAALALDECRSSPHARATFVSAARFYREQERGRD